MGCRNDKFKLITKSNRQSSKLTTSVKGSVGEYQEVINFLLKGYYVAKAVDPQCPFDLVVVDKKGKITLLDVKSNTYRKKLKKPHYKKAIGRGRTELQKKLNIKLLMIDPER
tara:strand:- start:41 stop:376 length:336 start_codon:yes stop_codon:yes gene_type:complete